MDNTGKLLVGLLLLVSTPAHAETADLQNPSWQKVPNSEVGDESAYIDVNSITRNQEIATFDVVEPDVVYSRLEANCNTNQLRSIRRGSFESKKRVRFASITGDWVQATERYYQSLLKFVCQTP
jgi:hypothetical protein